MGEKNYISPQNNEKSDIVLHLYKSLSYLASMSIAVCYFDLSIQRKSGLTQACSWKREGYLNSLFR